LSQHLDSLGQEYIGDFLSGGGKNKIIDSMYDVRLDKDGIMIHDSKKFDVNSSDHIIIDDDNGIPGIPGLYELKMPISKFGHLSDQRNDDDFCHHWNGIMRNYVHENALYRVATDFDARLCKVR